MCYSKVMPNVVTLSPNITTSLIALDVQYYKREANIILKSELISTKEIPNILEFLKINYPAALNTQCFNDKNLPFCEEVLNTEIGHLLEHIMIADLYSRKKAQGCSNLVFDACTQWDWIQDDEG